MPAMIICTPSWSIAEVLGDSSPAKIGIALVELLRRDGADTVSDELVGGNSWEYLDPTASGDDVIEGYGALAPAGAAGFPEYDYIYGIMSDGTLMVVDRESGDDMFVDSFAPDALDKLAEF